MPKELTIRFQLRDSSDGKPVLPVRTVVEVDGQQLGLLTSLEVKADVSNSIPTVRVDATSDVNPSDLNASTRASLEKTVEALSGFFFVQVRSPMSVGRSGQEE